MVYFYIHSMQSIVLVSNKPSIARRSLVLTYMFNAMTVIDAMGYHPIGAILYIIKKHSWGSCCKSYFKRSTPKYSKTERVKREGELKKRVYAAQIGCSLLHFIFCMSQPNTKTVDILSHF